MKKFLITIRNKVFGVSSTKNEIDSLRQDIGNLQKNLNNIRETIELNRELNFELQSVLNSINLSSKKLCPICKSSVNYFKLGPNRRPNARCPECNSLERHRLVWLYFQEKTNLFKKKVKLLHFAPEKCIMDQLLKCSNIDYLSADLDSPLVLEKIDIQNMNFSDNSFDVIYCSHVLEHVPDDKKAMRELHRVLKPSGWAVLMVPMRFNSPKTLEDPNIKTPEERLKHYGQADHLRYYGLDFKDRLEKVGFDVKVEDYVETFDEASREKYGFPKKEYVYFCTKIAGTV